MKLHKFLFSLLLSICLLGTALATEGMWIPLLLKSLNEAEMQEMGMKMSAEDIYSVNQGSLKDAIVHFGGFCTGELISDQGLLLTNHHCGYSAIQRHSSVEDNYLKNGFWAHSKDEEKPNPGLFATFIVGIEDVTKQVMKGVKAKLDANERQSVIDKNIAKITEETALNKFEEMYVRPFFKGNQYFKFVTLTYPDVRLVGAPPESIGKFGADTDNWVWPRHTGDFALFRIYADENNQPAEYAPGNQPFKPKHFFPISLDGVDEDDFTMVFGFPGRTNQYLPSYAVQQIMDVLDPAKIGIRDISLKVMDSYMRKDEATRLQYASKFASIANYWKKWIGESQGLRETGAMDKKHALETEFTQRINRKKKWRKKYGEILPEFESLYQEIEPYAHARDYYSEIFGRNVDLFRVMSQCDRLRSTYENQGEEAYQNLSKRLINYYRGYFQNYNEDIDRDVFSQLLAKLLTDLPKEFIPESLHKENLFMRALTPEKLVAQIFSKSHAADYDKLSSLFQLTPDAYAKTLKEDPAYKLYKDVTHLTDNTISTKYNALNSRIAELQRQYMAGLMEVFPEKRFWPDANSTLRVTYGKVNGYEPRDAVYYRPVTYLDGVIEKYKPGDYEFDLDQKLLDLHAAKDYGPYTQNGKVPVCFIGSNHTSGGNSGSPAIDAWGNLIGLNFDRVWEGTMSDINYDPSICRNIMVDIRYVLFIVDKYAGATHLIDEMVLVHPKKKS